MKELQLIEEKKAREEYIDRVEVLEQVKELVLLPNTELMTTRMVAEYYEVEFKVIEKCMQRNVDELMVNGMAFKRYSELKNELNYEKFDSLKISRRGVNVFSIEAILYLSFVLRDSVVAEKVRKNLMMLKPKLYYTLSNSHRLKFKREEQKYGDYLKFSFGEKMLKSQVKCGNYHIDYVLNDYVAIEIDECGHNGYNKSDEKKRNNVLIENNYIVVRFNPHKEKPFELMEKVINALDILCEKSSSYV